jgi:hypothetical protein
MPFSPRLSSCLAMLLLLGMLSPVPSPLAAAAAAYPLQQLQPADSRPLAEQSPGPAERLYPLAPPRRIGGTLRMDARLQVRGELSSFTWELPTDRSAGETFTAARLALRGKGNQVLFWCEGRECGESNLWANDILSNTRLLGGDDQQAFLLMRQDVGEHEALVAIYCVMRGNRRVALHAETLAPEAPLGVILPTPGTLLRELRDASELDFPKLPPTPEPEWVALLARTLNLDSSLRVRLSGAEVEQWQDALITAGVRAARLSNQPSAGPGLKLEVAQ